jgi:hypothetical protein
MIFLNLNTFWIWEILRFKSFVKFKPFFIWTFFELDTFWILTVFKSEKNKLKLKNETRKEDERCKINRKENQKGKILTWARPTPDQGVCSTYQVGLGLCATDRAFLWRYVVVGGPVSVHVASRCFQGLVFTVKIAKVLEKVDLVKGS